MASLWKAQFPAQALLDFHANSPIRARMSPMLRQQIEVQIIDHQIAVRLPF